MSRFLFIPAICLLLISCESTADNLLKLKRLTSIKKEFNIGYSEFKLKRDGKGFRLDGNLSRNKMVLIEAVAKIDADLNSIDGASCGVNLKLRLN